MKKTDALRDYTLQSLVGERIDSAHKAGANLYLVLASGETAVLEPWGDCCAHCFVADVADADALIGALVTAVEDLEQRDEPAGNAECQVWGHRIVTNQGICTIGMRVEHNGYYYGQLNVSLGEVPADAKPLEDFTS